MIHDRACPMPESFEGDCDVCDAIRVARSQELEAAALTWRVNLPLVTKRNYLAGYADGAAGHAPRYDG